MKVKGAGVGRPQSKWQQGGGFQGLLGNPLFNVGLGIMQANSSRQPISSGILGGLQNSAQYQSEQSEAEKKEEDRKLRKEERDLLLGYQEEDQQRKRDQALRDKQTFATNQDAREQFAGLLGGGVDTRTASINGEQPLQGSNSLGLLASTGQGGLEEALSIHARNQIAQNKPRFDQPIGSGFAGPEGQMLPVQRADGTFETINLGARVDPRMVIDAGGGQKTIVGKNTGENFGLVTPQDQFLENVSASSKAQATGTSEAARIDALETTAVQRKEDLVEVGAMLDKVKSGSLKTGKARGIVSKILPTEDEERLNALAEFAARARLKASGETKPTDADVEGMKRTLFNVDKTKGFTINSLERLQRELQAQDSALRAATGTTANGLTWEVVD